MHGSRILVLAILVLTLGTATTAAMAGTHPQDHNAWSIGFGFGGASAGGDGLSSSERDGGGMGNFRIGYPLNEKVSLAFEGNAWTKSENDVTLTFSATTFGVAFFPSEGLVLRGGLGFGRTTVGADLGGVTVSASESGFGGHGAIGYDFRVARTFALGPQLDFGFTTFEGGGANWVGLGVQFNWYFVPKS